MKRCGIYTITNTINNKIYVGSTTRLFCQRWGDHRAGLRAKKHANIHLQRAWDKYGEVAFEFKVIELVDSPENVLEREQYWMDKLNVYKSGYNRTLVAGNSFGIKRTPEQCKAKGKSDNWRRANAAWKGSKHTKESRQTIREKRAKQVMVFTQERKDNISKSLQGVASGNRYRMKYFSIKADNGTEVLMFEDMRAAMLHFKLKTNGSIGRVIRKERTHWHGWKFTCDEMT